MIYYVTGNSSKFISAKKYFDQSGLDLKQLSLDIDELQLDSVEEIAIQKAEQAFKEVGEPLFVNDTGWRFSALNGFPGPYMKYINNWFSPEDFLALMSRHEDKSVVFRQSLVYKDSQQLKIFNFDFEGKVIDEIRGKSGVACDKIISLTDDGKTIAEHKDEGFKNDESEAKMWGEFIGWLNEKK